MIDERFERHLFNEVNRKTRQPLLRRLATTPHTYYGRPMVVVILCELKTSHFFTY